MEVDFMSVDGALYNVPNVALKTYRKIGDHFKTHSTVMEVRHNLLQITSEDLPREGFDENPFIFLEGSSGSGKTQMCFNIMSAMDADRDFFYFLFTTPRSNSQEIYRNFANLSQLFKNCVGQDATSYLNIVSPSCSTLFSKSLFLYGFIYELLEGGISKRNVSIRPKTGLQIYDLLTEKKILTRRPIFIIDECIAIDDNTQNERLQEVRFVRNVFRSAGLGLIMLGTDSRAAKLTNTIGESSRSDIPRPWCYIVGIFPSVDVKLLSLPADTPDSIIQTLQSSRPLFAQRAALEIRNGKSFDLVLLEVFNYIVSVKKIFGNDSGRLGQIRLFQNAHYSLPGFSDRSTTLIHSHFAQIDGAKTFTLLNDGCKVGFDTPWKPCSAFPKLNDDVLLYLLLMGGKGYPAFRLESNTVPFAWFLLDNLGTYDHRGNILDFSNRIQKSNSGNFLEALLCTVVCVASHSNGIRGNCILFI